MGREVRRVPADWQHPKHWVENYRGNMEERFKALHDGKDYESRVAEWDKEAAEWARGEFPEYANEEDRKLGYAEWDGRRPDAADYMPRWPAEQCTHLMMYEDTTEGTPISPAFETPEELARWLVDNEASAFGDQTGSYEGWLRVARGGFAPSAVSLGGGALQSGVDGLATA